MVVGSPRAVPGDPQGGSKSLRTAQTETGAPSFVQIREFDGVGVHGIFGAK